MLELNAPKHKINMQVHLPGSKSSSNRIVILNHFFKLGLQFQNLSNSDDTRLLQKALEQIQNNKTATINIEHAGTDMRFLTALLACTPGEWHLSGSQRMKERPIGELSKALIELGADLHFLEKENYPPLRIKGKLLDGGELKMNAGISSQFVSALLLVAPSFPEGLKMELLGKIVSTPYIYMTVDLLKHFGADIQFTDNTITVHTSKLFSAESHYSIESDWSAASYWYSMCALSPGSEIVLSTLQQKSSQADAILSKLFEQLGVISCFHQNKVTLTHKEVSAQTFEFDFSNCPDIAQTIAVICFAKGIQAKLTGLSTLKVKETNRLQALKTELEKLGAQVNITEDSLLMLPPSNILKSNTPTIATYTDHRMALSFAPLALVYKKLFIEQPQVITKSYPQFWSDLKTAGFSVNLPA